MAQTENTIAILGLIGLGGYAVYRWRRGTPAPTPPPEGGLYVLAPAFIQGQVPGPAEDPIYRVSRVIGQTVTPTWTVGNSSSGVRSILLISIIDAVHVAVSEVLDIGPGGERVVSVTNTTAEFAAAGPGDYPMEALMKDVTGLPQTSFGVAPDVPGAMRFWVLTLT